MKNHFPLLDPLRFGAAVGVAVFHQMFWSWAWVSIGVPGFERYVAGVRAALGEESFLATTAEGRAMSLDDAVALALEMDHG